MRVLKVTKADVSSLEEVYEVCKGADAVISAFNPGWNNPDIYDETIKVYLTIIDGVKKGEVKPFSYGRRCRFIVYCARLAINGFR